MLAGLPATVGFRAAEDTLAYHLPEESVRELFARPEGLRYVVRQLDAFDQQRLDAPHDPDGVERRGALRNDHRAGGEELDLRLRRDRLEVLRLERVEGCDGGEELRDVVHDGRSYRASPARFCVRPCMLRSCPSS